MLLGETHGVAQTPVLLVELIARFRLRGIALEWHEGLRLWLDSWITQGVLTVSPDAPMFVKPLQERLVAMARRLPGVADCYRSRGRCSASGSG